MQHDLTNQKLDLLLAAGGIAFTPLTRPDQAYAEARKSGGIGEVAYGSLICGPIEIEAIAQSHR